MRTKQICMTLLFLLGVMPMAKAQTFDYLWKQVEQAEKKSLLQSVIQLTTDIFRKAELEKNSPQMLKAYVWRMKYRDELTPDSFYVDLAAMEQWATVATEKPINRAILHSLMANIYADFAAKNYWQLRQRTSVVDEEPSSDIREWSGNMFVQQVRKHTDAALIDKSLLLETSSRTYIPFVELGDASNYYHHDLFHLLAMRGVEALNQVQTIGNDSVVKADVERIYQEMLSSYRTIGKADGYLLTMLDYLEWKRNEDPTFAPYQAPQGRLGLTLNPYIAGLNKLMAEFGGQELCAEVYLKKARYAMELLQPALALQLCDEAIGLYGRYKRIAALKNLKQEILLPYLSVKADNIAYPEAEMNIRVNHKNLDGFTVYFYREKKQIGKKFYALTRSDSYLLQDTLFLVKAPAVGKYEITIVPTAKIKNQNNQREELCVTRLKVLKLSLPKNQCEAMVLDTKTGKPVEGATVTLYGKDKERENQWTTDAQGKVVFPYKPEYRYLAATLPDDVAMPLQAMYGHGYYYSDNDRSVDRVELLTDRALYRPGQTVYVKGIAYDQQPDAARVLVGRSYTLTLLDANRQEVAKKELQTNEFGSFTTEFMLPTACLNGIFTLSVGKQSTTIRVEEYKRPTFDITFDAPSDSYRLGDRVEVKGVVKSFSGAALQKLPVEYVVTRSFRLGWRQAVDQTVASGSVMLNEEGKFSIPIQLENDLKGDVGYYTYQVEATVTGLSGETQTSLFELNVGNRSMLLSMDLPNPFCKDDSISVTFGATNLSGQPVNVAGSYALYPLAGKKMDEAVKGTPTYTGMFISNKAMILSDWRVVPSGEYVLALSAKDDQGREVTKNEMVVLFSKRDTRPPTNTPLWCYEENVSFDATHPARFSFGTSCKEAYVLMRVFSGDRVLESKMIQLSDSIVSFEYPYQASYGNGLSVLFCFVKEDVVNQRLVKITRRLPSNVLNLKWDVFRDKLRPGQQEEWKLTLKTPQGLPAVAEMLATMYDASLDKIWKQNQALRVAYHLAVPTARWTFEYMDINSFSFWFIDKNHHVEPLLYDHFAMPPMFSSEEPLNTPLFEYAVVKQDRNRFDANVRTSVGGMAPGIMMSKGVRQDGENLYEAVAEVSKRPTLPEATNELRTNFAETAFFYPQLRTNEQGEISFTFTVPQSLTRWQFNGYAHTQDMLTGMIEGTTVTSKEFMLTPNMPRFVRVGDHTSIAASIDNLTGKNLSGMVRFTLFDPLTDKVISTQNQTFAVEAGRTGAVNFLFTVTDNFPVLGCRMIADGEGFSDGEQRLLPVLTNKVNLIETVSMPIRGKETRVFPLGKLFNEHSRSATDRRLTVEFTGNPAWYAVQALPSLGILPDNNAVSWAAVYYANTLASYIMESQPRIKTLFDNWKMKGETKETFLSNLQKNPELKSILLSESPWVMEAKTEQEQKERIATLFDVNNIRNQYIASLTRLKELQLSDGSWAWYKGMSGSRYVTDFIVTLNARLALLTGQSLEGDALTMQRAALGFLNNKALEEYKHIRQREKVGDKVTALSSSALRYLYLIAISGEKVPEEMKVAYHYFLSKVEATLATSSMNDKALAAIVLNQAGRKKEALDFMASLKEHLTQTDEQGMFFAFNEHPYLWNGMQIPVHVEVMEAFDRVTNDTSVVEEMKIWLLKQKQTQSWNSAVATADAVYALLLRGTSLLDNQGDVRIAIGDEVIRTTAPASSVVPGLGYIKKNFTAKRVVDASKITVEKYDAGIAWGAVYAQYQEELSHVKQQGNEMNVEKKLYVERMENNVSQLLPVTAETLLAVGDKIVARLIIRLDRAMEFVQLKEQRAACFEPIESLSGYRWSHGFGCYVDIKDASTHYFFDGLGKGVFVLEQSYRISRSGTYESGLTTLQCAYAPEYVSHSTSIKIRVK